MKTQIMTIQGKQYHYTLCPRCGVWIESEEIESHVKSPECDKWRENRGVRDRATGRALGRLHRVA